MDKTAIKNYAVEARRKLIDAVKRKAAALDKKCSPQEIENVACTWFNRLIALRIMEVNDWLPSNIRILSSREEGRLEPEAIREIGRLDYVDNAEVSKLLQATDMNAADRLYRYVLICQCKKLSSILPGVFKGVDSDDSYALLPDSLISKDGIVYDLVTKIEEDNFDITKQGQIEIIGWLYQFYISEKKDEVFAGLKKNVKINKDTIPAATQLFTPEWIVKYMVENSLGRLWLEHLEAEQGVEFPMTFPAIIKDNSEVIKKLKSNWKYYVEEAEQEPEVAKQLRAMRAEKPNNSPEDIKFIDPCMGSGHILVYAFEVLYQIYESEGYAERDIPNLILEKNLHGLDIDDRACQLAYFALMMKARSKNRRFFRQENLPQPMVYSAKGDSELEEFGSLIKVEDLGDEPDEIMTFDDPNYMDYETRLNGWKFRRLLTQKYDVVATNPPYMKPALKQADWITKNYSNSKSDLCVVFIERNFDLVKQSGYVTMITMHSWMFLSSYEKFRKDLVKNKTIINMAHLGARAFDEIGGEVVSTTAFVLRGSNIADYSATYARLVDFGSQQAKESAFLISDCRYITMQNNFTKIPSFSLVYWASKCFIKNYSHDTLDKYLNTRVGLDTSDNARFVRLWHEVDFDNIGLRASSVEEFHGISKNKWVPHTKGGEYRKWFGNLDCILRFDSTHYKLLSKMGNRLPSRQFYFLEGICWSRISTTSFAVRYTPKGMVFNSGCPTAFASDDVLLYGLGLLNSKIVSHYVRAISPTINFQAGEINRIPWIFDEQNKVVIKIVAQCIDISRDDWNSFEISWNFTRHPLLKIKIDTWWGEDEEGSKQYQMKNCFMIWKDFAESQFNRLKSNEEELNRIFIDIYGLDDELTSEVENKDVTVRKADLGRDIRSFISYAVGCMFGRYSLDEPGLVFAGGNFTSSRYKTYSPVIDNIIPIGVKDYFDNDIVVCFIDFVRTVYGEDTLGENLNFITDALYANTDGTTNEKLRRYFLNDFYKDHLKTYKNRPIYWMLDSGKKNGFKALIYLHRYNKYTMGTARTDYVHALSRKYEGELENLQTLISEAPTPRDRAIHQKEAATIQAAFDECSIYDQIIAHIAHQQIDLDLDDGVKVNYAKFQGVEVPVGDGKIEKMDLLSKI